MNRDDLELALQDYLDGRMDPAERARFEKRIAHDPDLAAAIADHHDIGDALRSGDDDLPETFYADARARFAALHSPRRVHDAFRWENAGLLAAALVVAAILLPVAWKQGLLPDSTPEATKVRSTAVTDDTGMRQDPAVLDEIRTQETLDAERDEIADADRFAPAPPAEAPRDARRKDEKKAAPDQAGTRTKEKSQAPEPVEERVESEYAKRIAANEPAPAPSTTAGADSPAKMSRTRSTAGRESDDKADAAMDHFAEAEGLGVGQSSAPRGAAVPAGVLPEGAVIDVTTAAAWSRWLDRVGGLGAERLAPRYPDERIVLIGPRPAALDCARIVRMPSGAIGVPLPPSGSGDAGGCAVVVPADLVGIEFLHHEGAR